MISDNGTALLSSFAYSRPIDSHSGTKKPTRRDSGGLSSFDWLITGSTTDYFGFSPEMSEETDVYDFGVTIFQVGHVLSFVIPSLMFVLFFQFLMPPTVRRPIFRAAELFMPEWFVPNHSFRDDLWRIVTRCVHSQPRPTIFEVVEWLTEIHAVASVRAADSVPRDDIEPTLKNLSAEIKKVDDLPVAAGGFSEVWKGQRLGKDLVALKVLRMYDIPAKIRKVPPQILVSFISLIFDLISTTEVF